MRTKTAKADRGRTARRTDAADWDGARYTSGQSQGHYESWFQRANHPSRPLAFWIRYTLLVPAGCPDRAIGERWAIWFDGERNDIRAARDEVPIARCRFSRHGLDAEIAGAHLAPGALQGHARDDQHALRWDLTYSGDDQPLLLLPERFYPRRLPRAKALVGTPRARFHGHIEVDGERKDIDGWPGSQNHNWGSRHTDEYAWGQVVGFDDAPGVHLELATARLKLGPIWTPHMTMLALRTPDRDYLHTGAMDVLRGYGACHDLKWRFSTCQGDVTITGVIDAPPEAFVGLTYRNPSGNTKICLNSKIARCHIKLVDGDHVQEFSSSHRAAFEWLSDEGDPRVPVVV